MRLTVAYDGRGFHGFADNPGVATVAGTLSRTIERVTGTVVELTGAGRTDAGVHAWGQVVSLDLPTGTELELVQRAINKLCGPALVVRAAEWADEGFDARFSARWRRYRYTIVNRPVPDPFLAATAWHVPQPLDLRVMTLACDPLIGEHDFSSFCRRPRAADGQEPPSLVRRVLDARWEDEGDGVLRLWITATAFCHQMVRSVTGTLVDIGSGRRTAGEMTGILRARSRAAAGGVAPPHGLCLWDVGY
ncbi:MAG: tRNA pseudouridine(38-40) synthase TruA [Acidimicrobiales bacterium]